MPRRVALGNGVIFSRITLIVILTRRAGRSFPLRQKFVLSAHVFDLDRTLVPDYQRFARTQIRAQDTGTTLTLSARAGAFGPSP
jgi:hypothetical protein